MKKVPLGKLRFSTHDYDRRTLLVNRPAGTCVPTRGESWDEGVRLSVEEEFESVVSANLQRATRLRQSVLQKALTGELS